MFRQLFETFRKPSPDALAARELEDSERQLLRAYTGLEYAQAMVNYHTATVTRLKARNQPLPAKVVKLGRLA